MPESVNKTEKKMEKAIIKADFENFKNGFHISLIAHNVGSHSQYSHKGGQSAYES